MKANLTMLMMTMTIKAPAHSTGESRMNNGCGPDEMADPNEDKVNPLCRCCCQKDDNNVVSLNEMFTAVQSSLGERRAIASYAVDMRLKAATETGPWAEST